LTTRTRVKVGTTTFGPRKSHIPLTGGVLMKKQISIQAGKKSSLGNSRRGKKKKKKKKRSDRYERKGPIKRGRGV